MSTAFQLDGMIESARVLGSSGTGDSMASKRYQQGCIRFDKKRNAWIVRYREDVIKPDGTVVRTRPQLVWSKKEVPTLPLAKRRLSAILSRINDYSYQPTRMATVAEFANQWRKEMLENFKPSSAQAGKSHLDCHIIPKLGNLRLEQLGPENQQKFVNSLVGCSRKPCSTSSAPFRRCWQRQNNGDMHLGR